MVKGLASVITDGEGELVVKLNFKPNSSSTQDDEFYATSNRNACVRCGKDTELTRFHVVPGIYRTHLPETLKSHRSHDIVLLDFDCLSEGLKCQHRLKAKLAKQYDASLKEISKYYIMNAHISGLKKIAGTLLKGWECIPQDKKDNLLRQVQEMTCFIVDL